MTHDPFNKRQYQDAFDRGRALRRSGKKISEGRYVGYDSHKNTELLAGYLAEPELAAREAIREARKW